MRVFFIAACDKLSSVGDGLRQEAIVAKEETHGCAQRCMIASKSRILPSLESANSSAVRAGIVNLETIEGDLRNDLI